MRIDTGQHMRMDQRMKLSPRMIQSMEILQLPALALEERIQQELETNPVLELLETDPDAPEPAPSDPDDAPGDDQPIVAGEDGAADDFQRLQELADRYGEAWEQNTTGSAEPTRRAVSDGEPDAKLEAMANAPARAACLADQLLDQWRFVECPDPICRAGEEVIGYIDDDGLLRTPLDEIAHRAAWPVRVEDLQAAVELLQRCVEPPGIGARDLPECLRLQLDALIEAHPDDPDLPVARRLVVEHLDDLEHNRLPRIARRTGLDMPRLREAMGWLRRLDTRPGRQLAPERAEAVVPDVLVEYDATSDRYVATITRGRQAGLKVDPDYEKLARDARQDAATRKFVRENIKNARWLLDALDQRRGTLHRVVSVVLEAQRDFFDHGPAFLKPLPMTLVADQLGIHVGTVSRAVSEKYMQTPRGVYPLRMFFSGGTESAGGQEMSWQAVQTRLKEIVDGEDPANPWSDDQLAEELAKRGLTIARRTVAKYRQQLGIASARQRRQY